MSFNKHFTSHVLLSDKQCRFRISKSSTDVLPDISDLVYQTLNKSGETWAVSLYISMAFDGVWPTVLIHRLKDYGETEFIFGLIQSFLTYHVIKLVLNVHLFFISH